VIESIVTNGVKSESATPSDIELLRAGASAPEAQPRVGTELMKGDWIKTKDDDQVLLRVKYGEEESDDLVLLDPNSHVNIGSVCAVAGRILAWVSSRFRLCTSWGTLGVSGTEFEVEVRPSGELTVVVYEGQVSLDQNTISVDPANPTRSSNAAAVPAEAPSPTPSPGAVVGEAFARVVRKETISTGKALKIEADGRVQTTDFSPDKRAEGIDRWSNQIIKASQKPAHVTKGYLNYSDDQRAEKFKQARREALLEDSSKGYLDMAQALNDWDSGAAAEKSLSKVKEAPVRESPEFMVNEAEAQRLQGNLSKATIQIDRAIKKHPGYAPAFYVSGKVSETKAATDPANKVNDLEAAKTSFRKALQNDSGKSQINAKAVEADLDKTIDILGKDALNKGAWFSLGHQWFTRDKAKWVSYTGTASLNVADTHLSGKAVLYIYGNQFKLKTAEKIYTGTITGTPHSGATSFAMAFDDLSPQNQVKGDVVISVIGTKTGNGIVLQSLPHQAASFSFKSQPAGGFGGLFR
jgi:hypothetical protein